MRETSKKTLQYRLQKLQIATEHLQPCNPKPRNQHPSSKYQGADNVGFDVARRHMIKVLNSMLPLLNLQQIQTDLESEHDVLL